MKYSRCQTFRRILDISDDRPEEALIKLVHLIDELAAECAVSSLDELLDEIIDTIVHSQDDGLFGLSLFDVREYVELVRDSIEADGVPGFKQSRYLQQYRADLLDTTT